MFKNNFKTAWRSLMRNKINSLINIGGLSIAIASVIFIMMYVKDELAFDQFFKDADHIFQVNSKFTDKGVTTTTGGNTAPAVTPTMLSMYPEIESYARIYRPGDVMIRYEANTKTATYFTEHRLLAVDSSFLEIFNYSFLQGDAVSCLQKPDGVVITEATAKKYFGNENAIGKILLFDTDKKPFTVTAILKNVPPQSTFQFDLLVPISAYSVVKKRSWNWSWLQVNSYVKLKPTVAVDKASIAKFEAKFPAMVREYAFKDHAQDYDEFTKKGNKIEYELMPFTNVHLYAIPLQSPARLTNLGDIKYVYIFSAIAFFIIILACVNFMNLSTAQSATRSKEIGIRKVLGSEKKQLVKQFLTEAMMYSFISTIFAIFLILFFLDPFNAVAGKTFNIHSVFSSSTIFFVLSLCVVTGLLAGLYPAFYLSSFNPVVVLKGMKVFKNNLGNLFIRNGLVIFQYTTSIALIICTIVVFRQLKYTQNRDMGLSKENVVEIANTKRLGNIEETFRREVTTLPGVIDASISGGVPTKGNFGDGYVPEATETDKPILSDLGLSSFMVDDHFIPTLKIQILQGRNFSKDFNDSASVILNETAVKQIGWKQPVGKYLDYPGNNQKFKVIGVVKDFNIASLHELIEPFALFNNSSKTYTVNSSYITVRLKPGNTMAFLNDIESSWKSFAPATPFDYSFLDEEFDSLYRSEQQMGKVFGIFTFLSIFVACLGLFGLSIYTAERRKKEIGVRKVLGASVQSVVVLLSKDFLKLVLIATMIACPVAWLVMDKWLQDFAYRENIAWWIFIAAGSLAILIAWLTISFQSIKAAIANPVKSLRTE